MRLTPALWLSGADSEILDGLGHGERTRFAGLGALVLAPAVLGGVSMTYAVSTVTEHPAAFMTAGVLWFVFLVAVDRYLVSTTHKSKVGSRVGRVLAVVVRYVFSVFVGIAVSHPLVMLVFDQSIDEQLARSERSAVAEIREQGEARRSRLTFESPAAETLPGRLELSDCLGRLLTAEQSGQRVELPCGVSSGLSECRTRCIQIAALKQHVDDEVAGLRASIAQEAQAEQEARAMIDRQTAANVAEVERHFSHDYLARVDALHQVKTRAPHVVVVERFLLLFFILVDVLPVTVKLATAMGEYEEVRDTRLLGRRAREAAKREITAKCYEDSRMIDASAADAALREQVAAMTSLGVDIVHLLDESSERLDAASTAIQRRARRTRDAATRADLIDQLHRVRTTSDEIWQSVPALVRGHLAARSRSAS